MATKHGKVVTYCERLTPMNLHNPVNVWSCDKLKILYLHYYQGGDITQGIPTHKFAYEVVNEVVLWGQVTNQINFIFTGKRSKDTKLGKVLTSGMTLWSRDQHSRDSLRNLYLHFQKTYEH